MVERAAERFLGLRAGLFPVSLPLVSVRQILDMGGATGSAPTDPRALGVAPVSLAKVLGATPDAERPALLLLDGKSGPLLLSADALDGVLDATQVTPLPPSVGIRFPGLLRGLISHDTMRLVLDPDVLAEVVEIRLGELAAEDAP